LKRWGYNDKVIESGFSKVGEINRNDLLEYKEKKDQQTGSPCSLTYHPSLEKISGIVRHHLEKSEMLTPFLSSCYGTLVRVAIGDSTCNACHHMVNTGRPSMKV
jgi:hypothetical protein